MTERRTRTIVGAIAVVIVALIATALALGGSSSSDSSSSGTMSSATLGSAHSSAGSAGASSSGSGSGASAAASAPGVASGGLGEQSAPMAAPSAPGAVAQRATSSVASSADGNIAENVADGVTATRVVKTGSLGLRVARGQVDSTMSKLVLLTNTLHGYVSKSSTTNELGTPDGLITLRIPAAGFDTAVNDAEKFGKVQSLTTNATDVTGKYVDLGARLSALKRTRSTYLTILGQAHTIGATLSVQQRVDDVQQQIEELQGQLKVLANQSADGTLTVDVSAPGPVMKHVVHHPHHRSGIARAWHRSVTRFERGGDAIIGALGPLLLALLIVGALLGVGLLGYRGVRRFTGTSSTG